MVMASEAALKWGWQGVVIERTKKGYIIHHERKNAHGDYVIHATDQGIDGNGFATVDDAMRYLQDAYGL